MNTSELKQTLVARACSYELAQAIADEIDRLRADLNAAKTALENQIAHTTEIANLCTRQRAWIDGVMAQESQVIRSSAGVLYPPRQAGNFVRQTGTELITRPAPFEDK